MTRSQPDALAAVADEEVSGPDTEGCLCVVACHSAAALLVSAASAEAARRIMGDPSLGDFVTLRFVDMGPQPGLPGDRSDAVRLITRELLASGGKSGRNYLAIVIADHSAAEAELVMTECADDPFLATLPIRLHGIASLDDRRSERDAFSGTSFAVAPSGAWGYPDLIDELRRYADELLRECALGQRGLSPGEFDLLRVSYEQRSAIERGEKSPEDPETAGPGTPELPSPSAPAAQLDVLAAAPPQHGSPQHSSPQPAPPQHGSPQLAPSQPAPAQPLPAGSPPPPTPDSPPAQSAAPASPLARLPRRLLELGWRRLGKQPEPGNEAQAEAPRPTGLAYLLVTGEDVTDDQAAEQRSWTAMLRVDAEMATLSHARYLVRVLQGDEDKLRGDLRPAGQLSRRDVRQQVAYTDFAMVLEEIRALLRRDVVHVTGSGAALVRPVVMFFVPDPPLADPVAVDVFSHLAREASIIWVMPSEARDLLAPAFGELPHVSVLPDDEDLAGEIADRLFPAASAIAVASAIAASASAIATSTSTADAP